MAIHYVDYEGSAGTGDGSSFANRIDRVKNLSSVSAGDEIRIKKTPDPTSLGTGQVFRSSANTGYGMMTKNASGVSYSTTTGETKLTSMGNGWHTGDIIHIYHAETAAGKNLSGYWRVTVDNLDLKLDGFPGAPDTNATSSSIYWHAAVNTIYLNTNNLTKSIACRGVNRTSWTIDAGYVSGSYTNHNNGSNPSNFSSTEDAPTFQGYDQFTVTAQTINSPTKLAHYQLPSTLDLSGFQQVSFLFRHDKSPSDPSIDKFSLRLCTDTAGSTSVHTIPIDPKGQRGNMWEGFTVDLGTNLNTSIQSIALYQESTTLTTVAMRLDNVIACKSSSSADSISLDKLVGLNTTDDPAWYPIRTIIDNIVVLNTGMVNRPSFGYYGSNAAAFSASNSAATIYQREQYRADDITSDGNDFHWDYVDPLWAGTLSNPITISGGWDATSMSTRNGKTCVKFNGRTTPLELQGHYQHMSHMYWSNFGNVNHSVPPKGSKWSACGWSLSDRGFHWVQNSQDNYGLGFDFAVGSSQNRNLFNIQAGNFLGNRSDYYVNQAVCSHYGGTLLNLHNVKMQWEYINLVGGGGRPVYQTGATTSTYIHHLKMGYNSGSNYTLYAAENSSLSVNTLDILAPYYRPVQTTSGAHIFINNLNTTIDTTFNSGNARFGVNKIFNHNLYTASGSITVLNAGDLLAPIYADKGSIRLNGTTSTFPSISVSSSTLESIDHLGVTGDDKVFCSGSGLITPETTTRHTASGRAWKCTSGVSDSGTSMNLGKIVVSANNAVTIGIWTYKSHATDSTIELIIKDDLSKGIINQSVDTSNTSAATWAKIEKTVTPTRAGTLDIVVNFKNGAGAYGIIDDLEVSQV